MSHSISALTAWLTSYALIGLGAAQMGTAHAADFPLYAITKTITLGSPEKWDFVNYDDVSHRVFVAHETEVTVVDGRSGDIVGHVDVAGANGVAVIPALGKGYAGSRAKKAGIVFDLNTFKILKEVPADSDTDGVIYDPASKRVFIIQGDPHNITAIDPATDTAVATVALDGKPEFATADGAGKLYVAITDKSEVARVDTKSAKEDAAWPVADCVRPHGMAMDRKTRRLFMSCANNTMAIIDADNGRVVTTAAIGKGTDSAAFDTRRKLAFSSNGDGTLSIIREDGPDKFTALGDVPTQILARTMAVDSDSGRVYTVTGEPAKFDPNDTAPHRHIPIQPGSVRLLFVDPAR
ncbi:MAG: YncE family protein [Rhodospirillaceae bacterium]|nr:MAG: YncE family protein [Rhodospirillaceae bacterium]